MCPFCSETIAPGLMPRARHIGRHLEDIALTAIPRSYNEWQYYEDSSSATTEKSAARTYGFYSCTFPSCYQRFDKHAQLREHRWNEHQSRSQDPSSVWWVPEPSSARDTEFQCDLPGCTAKRFVAQYLLNQHTNVHYRNRPWYCPATGCSRGEGTNSKGFWQKSTLIWHYLEHLSHRCICPFCPEGGFECLRPYDLVKHVTTGHPDRNIHDPRLRAELGPAVRFLQRMVDRRRRSDAH